VAQNLLLLVLLSLLTQTPPLYRTYCSSTSVLSSVEPRYLRLNNVMKSDCFRLNIDSKLRKVTIVRLLYLTRLSES